MDNTQTKTRKQEFNEIQRRTADFYKEPTTRLLKHLIKEHGYTIKDLCPIIGFSDVVIKNNYLREKSK